MLKGKTAVITGASRGIGRAIAIRMAKLGAQVIINYNGSEEQAREAQREIVEEGGRAFVYRCDVSDFKQCEHFVKEIVEKFGRIDILVNNAGITKDGLLMSMSEEAFDKVLEVNLKGTFNMIRFVSRQMLKQKSGRIVNMASVVGVSGNAGQANYAASKAGVIGLTKSAAKELASRGITVNAIAPGYISTDMTGQLKEEIKAQIASTIPAGVLGDPEQVAHAAAFLASEEASYITGQVLHVDGGMCM